MKGIELPINILIIIAIAVIVLIALVAMFYPAFSGGSTVVTSEAAKSAACQILVEAKNCATTATTNSITIPNFDADRDGRMDSGSTWCWGLNDPVAGCPAVGSGDCSDAAGVEGDNLGALCECYYSITSEARCRALCGC